MIDNEETNIVVDTSTKREGYYLIFNEEFDQQTLHENYWYPYYLPQWSSRTKSKPQYRFKESELVLQITDDQLPWCEEFNGNVKVSSIQSGCFSGILGSSYGQHRFNKACVVREEQPTLKLFTFQYGYIEIRARVTKTSDTVFALWLIGFEDIPERSSEICVMEVFGNDVINNIPHNGYGIHPFSDPALTDEFYKHPLEDDPCEYVTYAADWQKDHVDFYVNNEKVKTILQSPAYEMQLMLNIYELPNASRKETSHHYPKEFFVDYIRVWQMK